MQMVYNKIAVHLGSSVAHSSETFEVLYCAHAATVEFARFALVTYHNDNWRAVFIFC